MKEAKMYGGLDLFRVIAAVLIVAIHTSPFLDVNATLDFAFTRVIARVAVPFFFMTSGFFLFKDRTVDWKALLHFCKKIVILYGVAILFYLPVNLYTGYFNQKQLLFVMIKDLVFDGTMYHLWYLPAALLGAVLAALLLRNMSLKVALSCSLFLYLIGLFGDSYYGLASSSEVVKTGYQFIFLISEHTRNGIFFAPIFILLGASFQKKGKNMPMYKTLAGLFVSLTLLLLEGLLLHTKGMIRHDSMYLLLLPTMYFLFLSILQWKVPGSKSMREVSLIIYLIHPMVIIFLRAFAKLVRQEELLIANNAVHFIVVALISGGLALIINLLLSSMRIGRSQSKRMSTGRSWLEVNLRNLRYNAKLLKKMMPPECEMMAVVKANAYGHGAVAVSRCMNKLGVKAFAVATIDEGIELRKRGIKGDILVLGYTDILRASELRRYRLIQTIIDYEYAVMLSNCKQSLEVHIKVDTGMHRLGMNVEDMSGIIQVFGFQGLKISGIFTHLCVADSLKEEDISYTRGQITRFYHMLDQLVVKGITLPKVHIQSSYGLLNYPDLSCDYARIGIALYGSLSNAGDQTVLPTKLRPVLELKARVAMIREVAAGEGAGYGRDFSVTRDSKVAVLPIGYADGLPRNLSQGAGYVLLEGQKAPILGRICMDQLLVDVTDIPEVKAGDIATLIGRDGSEEIKAASVANCAGSITNELFSRIGYRLGRVYMN